MLSQPQTYGTINQAGVYSAPTSISTPVDATVMVQLNGSTESTTATIHLGTYYVVPGGSLLPGYGLNPGVGQEVLMDFQYTTVGAEFTPPNFEMMYRDSSGTVTNACYMQLYPVANQLRLLGDNATGFANNGLYYPILGYTFNGHGSGFEYNGQCQVNLFNAWVTWNNSTRTLNWAFPTYFEPTFSGGKFLYARKMDGSSPWVSYGPWTVPVPATKKPSGAVLAPAANATVSGNITISGWALDNATTVEGSVTSVTLYLDGNLLGTATMGQSSTACTTYPNRLGCPNVGFTYSLNTLGYGNGAHQLMVVLRDNDGPVNLRTVLSQTLNISN